MLIWLMVVTVFLLSPNTDQIVGIDGIRRKLISIDMSKLSDNKINASINPNLDKIKQGKKLKVMSKKKPNLKRKETSTKKPKTNSYIPVDSRSSKRENKNSVMFNKKMLKIKKGKLNRSVNKDF